MTVATPPRGPEIEHDRDLEERVADLEALIEEARRRARRRRQRMGLAALLVAAAVVAALIGFGGHGGGAGSAATARARSPQSPAGNTESSPLGALPPQARAVDAFAFDPRNPEIVYVLSRVLSSAASHVFKTTDGGAHWQATAASGSGWSGSRALIADPEHPGTLYAGTDVAVYKTVDGGRSWRPSKRGLIVPPPTEHDRGWVMALAVDPANANIVYAGSDRISKSTDGGHSWKTIFPPHPTGYPAENVSALAIAPTRPETIYAITGDFASRSATPAEGRTTIYKSTDAGTTWQATTVVRGSVAPTSLAVDPRHASTVYAAIGANFLKTINAGETWQPINGRPLPTHTRGTCHCLDQGGVKALAVDPRRTGTVYAALTQGGIYKTSNGGQTWSRTTGCTPPIPSRLNVNCPDHLLYLPIVAVDPARPTTIYAAGQTETGDGPRILRSTNSGRTWTSAP